MNTLFTATLLAASLDGTNSSIGPTQPDAHAPMPFGPPGFQERSGVRLPLIGSRRVTHFYETLEGKTFEMLITSTELNYRIREVLVETNYVRVSSVHRSGSKLQPIGTIIEACLGDSICLECLLPTDLRQKTEIRISWFLMEGVCFSLGSQNGISLDILAYP